jgi:hypothetical protein
MADRPTLETAPSPSPDSSADRGTIPCGPRGSVPRQETVSEAYCRGRTAPLLSSARELLYRPLPSGGVELVLGLDRLPDHDTLLRLAGETDRGRVIRSGLSSTFPSEISPEMIAAGIAALPFLDDSILPGKMSLEILVSEVFLAMVHCRTHRPRVS